MSDTDSNIGDPSSYAGGADTGGLSKSYSATDYAASEITPEMAAEFAPPNDVEQAISVRPHRDNGGIEAMIEVLESLHTVETTRKGLRRRTVNVSPAHAAEIRYTADENGERSLSLQYVPGSQSLAGTFEGQLQTRYDESLFDRTDPALLPVKQATAAEPDESGAADGESVYISGATLALRKYTLFPIKNISLPGFRSDPTGAIMQEMVDSQNDVAPDADVVVQIMFRPEDRGWRQGVSGGHGITDEDDPNITGELSLQELSFNLNQPTIKKERMTFTKEKVEYPASKVDKKIANLLEEQQGEKGWHLCLRVFALSKDPEVAKRRASKTAGMFENFYEANSEQTFIPQPISQRNLTNEYADAAAREFEETGIVKAQGEIAGLVNIPEAKDIATNKMQWSLAKPGDGVPPKTPRFPFDDYGAVSASDHLKQTTIFDTSSPGDPFYFGWGAKHGTEAGIFSKFLDAHMFIAGRTRYGKTVLTEHFCSQVFEREQGALVIDPKGDDADDFIREWPEHRDEEDLIVMDLGLGPDDEPYENIPRFNFMEIPPGYDPDSRFAATMIEALADDIAAMVAQSGGSEKYLGALMKRVTKTVSRGLLRSGRGVSLLDLACACSSQTGLSEFSRWMDDERITFIRETAKRFEEKEDTDLEPLAGRMDEWIHNDAIRDLISARNPSFSIHEAVEEGKVIVLRFAKGAGETERRLLTTALIRRTYASKRVCDNESPFYLVCDEFDKIATEESNLHTILSEAGGHNYRCVMACQAPGNQLPGRLKNAVGNQCDTFLSFNPGTKNADFVAEHHSVDAETLREMPRYKCYLRTHTSTDDNTHSYLVNAFEPIQEVRESATGETGMSDEEVEALKVQSMERYGEPIESAEEQQKSSAFYLEGDEPIPEDGEAPDPTAAGQTPTQRLYEAAHTVQIRRDAVGESVPYEEVIAELRRIASSDLGSDNKVANLIEETPDTELEKGKQEGERVLTLTTEGLRNAGLTQDTGSAENGGGFDHRLVLAKAKAAFVKLGYATWLPTQDSNEAADGMADLPVDPMATNDPTERRKREQRLKNELPHVWEFAGEYNVSIEAETSTMDAPEQTLTNLRKAINSGRFCVFALKDETFGDPEQFDHWRERGEKIIYDTYRERGEVKIDYDTLTFASETDENGNRLFYNEKKNHLKIEDGVYALRPVREEGSTQIRWEEEYGEVVLRDTGVKEDREEIAPPQEYMRFDSPEAVADVEREDTAAYYEYDQSKGVYIVRTKDGGREEYETKAAMQQNWRRIYAPFIPENEYRRTPTPDDFCFVVFPDADNPEYDEPQIAAKGEFEPLLTDEITLPETPEELAEESEGEDDDTESGSETGSGEEGETEDGSGIEEVQPEQPELVKAVASEIAAKGVSEAQAVEQTRQVLTAVDPTQLTEEQALTMVTPLFDGDLPDPAESGTESTTNVSETAVPQKPTEAERPPDGRNETEPETEVETETEAENPSKEDDPTTDFREKFKQR